MIQSDVNGQCPSLRFVGNWPFGPSLALVLDAERNLAFMSGGGAVYILDISNPEPTEIQVIRTRGVACDHGTRNLFYNNGKLYIANARAGLLIWDVSTPSNPHQLGTCDTTGQAYSVFVYDQHAYVAADEAGLRIIDIANPASPQEVGFLETKGHARGIYVRFPLVYLAAGEADLQVIDVSDPSNPYVRSSFEAADITFLTNVFLQGDHAYLTAHKSDTGGLVILDISNPDYPIKTGEYIFITRNDPYDVYVQGNRAFVVNFNLFTIDVSDPSNPEFLSESILPGVGPSPGWGFNVAAKGDYVYVAGDMGGMAVFDASNTHKPEPQPPVIIGQFRTPGWSQDVDIEGDYAFMADDLSGLFIVDISDPANPQEVGHYDFPSWARGVEVEGNYAYVAARNAGFRILDVSLPASPVEVGYTEMDTWLYALAVKGNYAYVTDNKTKFIAVDVSNVEQPHVVGTWDLENTTSDDKSQNIYIEEPYAFIAHFEHGLRIIDISNPTNLSEIGYLKLPGVSKDVWVRNGHAFVTGTEGLYVVNVSDPEHPTMVGHLDHPGYSYSLFLKYNYAFLGMHEGLCVVNISDPLHPVLVDSFPSFGYGKVPEYSYSLHVTPGLQVYVANGNMGLQIFKADIYGCPLIPIPRAYRRILIDGICDPLHEWIDAFAIDISRSDIPVILYIAVDEIEGAMYVGIDDYSNEVLGIGDYSAIFFDENNDGNWSSNSGHEGRFMMAMKEAGSYTEFRSIYLGNGVPRYGTPKPFPKGVHGAMSDESGHVQMEWKIDLSKSALRVRLQETLGLYIESGDSEKVTGALPPDGNSMDPSTFMAALVGCQNVEESKAAGNCKDGVDNDCDGDVDCFDLDCECNYCEAITGNECVDNICCVINNLYEESERKATHGSYVNCVVHAVDSCGLDGSSKGEIIRKAAKSSVNKKKKKKDH